MKYKYFTENKELTNEIKLIEREFYLSMNGICADKMEDLGLNYKKNWGVTLQRLEEIAKMHTKSYEIAERLWWMTSREAKIMAILLCPIEAMTSSRLSEWQENITTIELAETISMKLLSRNRELIPYTIKQLTNSSEIIQIAATHALARQIKEIGNDEIKQIIDNLPYKIESISLYRAIESLLLNLINDKEKDTKQINDYINKVKQHDTKYNKGITEIITDELEYRATNK